MSIEQQIADLVLATSQLNQRIIDQQRTLNQVIELTGLDVQKTTQDRQAIEAIYPQVLEVNQMRVYYGPDAPENPLEWKEWVKTPDLRRYTYYNDGDSSQWVELPTLARIADPLSVLAAQVAANLSQNWASSNAKPDGVNESAKTYALQAGASASQASGFAGQASTSAQAAAGFSNSAQAFRNQAEAAKNAAIAAQSVGMIGFATRAEQDANLNFTAGTISMVTNDTLVTNNGFYRKTGASGTGSWVQSSPGDLALLRQRTEGITQLALEPNLWTDIAYAKSISATGSADPARSGTYSRTNSAATAIVSNGGRDGFQLTFTQAGGNWQWSNTLANLGMSVGGLFSLSMRLLSGSVIGGTTRFLVRQLNSSGSEITAARVSSTITTVGTIGVDLDIPFSGVTIDSACASISILIDSQNTSTVLSLTDFMIARGRVAQFRPAVPYAQPIDISRALSPIFLRPNLLSNDWATTVALGTGATRVVTTFENRPAVQVTNNGEWYIDFPVANNFPSGFVTIGGRMCARTLSNGGRLLLMQRNAAGNEISSSLRITLNLTSGVPMPAPALGGSIALDPACTTVRFYISALGGTSGNETVTWQDVWIADGREEVFRPSPAAYVDARATSAAAAAVAAGLVPINTQIATNSANILSNSNDILSIGEAQLSSRVFPPDDLLWPEKYPFYAYLTPAGQYKAFVTTSWIRSFVNPACFTVTPYYVDPTRPDNNGDGLTLATAKRDINAAITTANLDSQPAMRILLAGGDYHQTRSINGSLGSGGIEPTKSAAFIGLARVRHFAGTSETFPATRDATFTNSFVGGPSTAVRVFDRVNLTNGLYTELTLAPDAASVDATPNSYCVSSVTGSSKVHIRRADGAQPTLANTLITRNINTAAFDTCTSDLYFENIDFEGGNSGALWIDPPATRNVVSNNCTYRYAGTSLNFLDGFRVRRTNGLVLVINGDASANAKDGWNYHYDDGPAGGNMYVLQINCTGQDNGRYTSTSNNSFTTHDRVIAIDINGNYGPTNVGAVFHCIEYTRTWALGTKVFSGPNGGTDQPCFKASNYALMFLQGTQVTAASDSAYAVHAQGVAGQIYLKDHVTLRGQQIVDSGATLSTNFGAELFNDFEDDLVGYADLWLDNQGRILSAIPDNEAIRYDYLPRSNPSVVFEAPGPRTVTGALTVTQNATIGGSVSIAGSLTQGRAIVQDLYEDDLFGYIAAEVDGANRIIQALGDDGLIYCVRPQDVTPTADASLNEVAVSSSVVAYIQELSPLSSGNASVIASDQTTGRVRTIASSGYNTRLSITPDNKNVVWMQRQSGILTPVYAPVDGSAVPYRVKPTMAATQWGDSLTEGSGASAPQFASVFLTAGLLGISVSNQGIGGQNSTQIAARMGAIPITLTVTGGSIPSSGTIGCTAVTPAFLTTTATNASRSRTGWIVTNDGTRVYGTLSKDTNNAYSFTRSTAGDSKAVSAGAPFVIEDANDLAGRVTIIAAGTNDTSSQTTLDNIAKMVDYIKTLDKRYLIQNLATGTSDPIGSANYTRKVLETNTQLLSTYGDHVVRIREALLAGANPASAQDQADVANGIVPTSLRTDGIHWNDAGHAIVANAQKSQADAIGLLINL